MIVYIYYYAFIIFFVFYMVDYLIITLLSLIPTFLNTRGVSELLPNNTSVNIFVEIFFSYFVWNVDFSRFITDKADIAERW